VLQLSRPQPAARLDQGSTVTFGAANWIDARQPASPGSTLNRQAAVCGKKQKRSTHWLLLAHFDVSLMSALGRAAILASKLILATHPAHFS